ncbi:MAG: DUF2752 domain-containing protein [Rikenellaceae bacterium]|nr:DUF2752 domain-containing protein [Rikenellaceae bacterium]
MRRLSIISDNFSPVLKNLIFIFGIIAGYIFIWYKPEGINGGLCIFKTVTGLPCPGCGGIRTTKALLNFEFLNALSSNPLSVITNVYIIFLVGIAIAGLIRKEDTLVDFLYRKWNKILIVIVLFLVVSEWVWNIYRNI